MRMLEGEIWKREGMVYKIKSGILKQYGHNGTNGFCKMKKVYLSEVKERRGRVRQSGVKEYSERMYAWRNSQNFVMIGMK